jgi:hypothetical protein
MVQPYDPSTWEAKAVGSGVPDWSRIQSENLPLKRPINNNNNKNDKLKERKYSASIEKSDFWYKHVLYITK